MLLNEIRFKNEDGCVLLKETWKIKEREMCCWIEKDEKWRWVSVTERKNQMEYKKNMEKFCWKKKPGKDENKDGNVLLDKVQKESMNMMKMSVNKVYWAWKKLNSIWMKKKFNASFKRNCLILLFFDILLSSKNKDPKIYLKNQGKEIN